MGSYIANDSTIVQRFGNYSRRSGAIDFLFRYMADAMALCGVKQITSDQIERMKFRLKVVQGITGPLLDDGFGRHFYLTDDDVTSCTGLVAQGAVNMSEMKWIETLKSLRGRKQPWLLNLEALERACHEADPLIGERYKEAAVNNIVSGESILRVLHEDDTTRAVRKTLTAEMLSVMKEQKWELSTASGFVRIMPTDGELWERQDVTRCFVILRARYKCPTAMAAVKLWKDNDPNSYHDYKAYVDRCMRESDLAKNETRFVQAYMYATNNIDDKLEAHAILVDRGHDLTFNWLKRLAFAKLVSIIEVRKMEADLVAA